MDKATTLEKLNINSAIIPKILSFKVTEYQKNKIKFQKKIKKNFNLIAIRSSNFSEDQINHSSAGKFKSFLNIKTADLDNLNDKIEEVIKSYRYFKNKQNKVFVQKMVKNIKISGVATSCDKNDGSPYYVINFSNSSDSTIITSGKELKNETFYLYEKYKKNLPQKIRKIKKLIDELKLKLKENHLDIEFAIDKNNKLYLLQVRKLIIKSPVEFTDKNFSQHLKRLNKKISKVRKRNQHLLGKTTYFGVMPDWNPAEIIGRRPSPLALSLYKELITDNTWASQRKQFGYRDVENHQLLSSFYGMPYIDMRIDFNSWIPAKINKKIAEKLINFYLFQFKKNPNYHDKIEFKIALTCFSLSLNRRLNQLPKKKFSISEKNQIFQSLKKINLNAYSQVEVLKKKLQELEKRILKISKSNIYYLDKIYWLIEDCKKFGTLPFAGLARCGFIGIEFLNSMVEEKIINENEKEKFLKSVKTIATSINLDFHRLSKKKFIKKYGHLRPNTYDIETKNYNEGYNYYFNEKKNELFKNQNLNFEFSSEVEKKLQKALQKNNHLIDAKILLLFIRDSIKLREYSKFIFSKSINEIFENLKLLFKRINLKTSLIKYLSIQSVKKLSNSVNHLDLKNIFLNEIKISKVENEKNFFIKLPANIYNEENVYFFKLIEDEPNFITKKNITANRTILKDFNKSKYYSNKIVCIENADPGYDFLFSHGIKGLITKYGGVNSHMSIRCNELSIPAAIGVGDKIFSKVTNSKIVQLNCQNNTIKTF